MMKRLISLVIVFVMFSSLACSAADVSIDTRLSTITPMFSKSVYDVYLKINVKAPYSANCAYIALYNKNGRMIDMKYKSEAVPRIHFEVLPEEYPVTVKAFVWSAGKTAIPVCETFTYQPIKSANEIISEQLESFVALLKEKTKNSMPGSFMVELTNVLDSIDEYIIEDAKNNELVIDKKLFRETYPEAYSKVKQIAQDLKATDDGINKAISELSAIINNNAEYDQLSLTLFTLLGVYEYFG